MAGKDIRTEFGLDYLIKNKSLNYEEVSPLLKAAIEGYVASSCKEFPPKNPYAIGGLHAGEEDSNLLGAAWFFGYWERSYCRNGEEKVFGKSNAKD